MEIKTLITLGLSPEEASIYSLLAEKGELTAKEIVELSSIKKGDCYNKLYSLVERDLVEEVYKRKKKHFRIEHPEKLEKLFEEKNREFDESKKKLLEELPQIVSSYNLFRHKPGVFFFEGIEGIKQVYQDTLKYPESDIYALASIETIPDELARWLESYYVKARREKNIKAFVIANQSAKAQDYQKQDKEFLRQTKLVEPSQFSFRMEVNLYGNSKVAFISYSPQELIGVIIESRAIYETLRAWFEMSCNM